MREYVNWWSPSLGRNMDMLAFGSGGTPVLVFPSSLGRFFEWEDFGMIEALSGQLGSGQNRLYCVDSVDSESLYNKNVDPYVRIIRHGQYQQYIFEEVVPFIRRHSGSDFLIVTGASFGAYHAANYALKQPWMFRKLIALSGSYDVRSFLDGFYDDNVYFQNPVDYARNLDDHHTLEALRSNHLIFAYGEHDPCRGDTELMSGILASKAINHTSEMWSGQFGHDWPFWREMIKKYIA